ncbi:MAG: hypothetical protein FWD16_04955 [Clostridia bacterium]|nr:hypothetical protein [Clostridia bacterium]
MKENTRKNILTVAAVVLAGLLALVVWRPGSGKVPPVITTVPPEPTATVGRIVTIAPDPTPAPPPEVTPQVFPLPSSDGDTTVVYLMLRCDLTNAEEMLAVLESHNVRANFYVSNEAAKQTYQEPLLKKIAQAKHVLAQFHAGPLTAGPGASFFETGFAQNDTSLTTIAGDAYDKKLILLPEDPSLAAYEKAAQEQGFTAYFPTAIISRSEDEHEDHPDWLMAIGDFDEAVAIMPMDREGDPFTPADLEWLIDYLQTHDFEMDVLHSDVHTAG